MCQNISVCLKLNRLSCKRKRLVSGECSCGVERISIIVSLKYSISNTVFEKEWIQTEGNTTNVRACGLRAAGHCRLEPLSAAAIAGCGNCRPSAGSMYFSMEGRALHYSTCCNLTCKLYMMLSDVHLQAYRYVGLTLNGALRALSHL